MFKTKNYKFIFYLAISVFLTLGLSISFQSLLADWTEPAQDPPNQTIGNLIYDNDANSNTVTIGAGIATTYITNALSVGGNAVFSRVNTGYGNNELYPMNQSVRTFDSVTFSQVTAGSFIYSSDEKLKENIVPIDNALEKILAVEGIAFNWKDKREASLGIIAQDVEGVFPELVHTNPDTGLKSVEYGNLVAPLIEALREQQGQIEDMKKEIEDLKNKLN